VTLHRAFGYRPDPVDHRDRILRVPAGARIELPAAADNIELLPYGSSLDQGPLGSCIPNAISYALIMGYELDGEDYDPLSRLFLYWHARNQHGDSKVDSGTYIREAIKVCAKLGIVSERLYPYVVNDLSSSHPTFTRKPGPDPLIGAHDHRVGEYQRITEGGQRKYEIMSSVASRRGTVLGTLVGWDFVEYPHHTTGTMRTFEAPALDNVAGGHAMCVVGYDAEGVVIVQSWRNWGFNGFARLSWSYVCNSMTQDIWSIKL
jgi:C1A family cysteine protease